MSSIQSLANRVKRLEKLYSPGVKHWHIGLVEGTGIPPEIQAQIGPHDKVLIREIDAGYISDLVDERGVFYAWYSEQFHQNNNNENGHRKPGY